MNIFIYGDSNTWAQEPNLETYSKDAVLSQYPQEKIWWNCLNNEHELYINGLCGRSISQENPYLEDRRALDTIYYDTKGLPTPDLIIIQLGTNDMKSKFNMTASEIALSLGSLIDTMKSLTSCENFIIVSPAYMRSGSPITDKYYKGANYKSVELDKCYKQLAKDKGLIFVSGLQAQTGIDGEHLSPAGHKYIARKVYDKVSELNSSDQPNK